MQIFDNTEPGIVLNSLSQLTIGATKIPLDDALMSRPGAIVDGRLMHAELRMSGFDHYLTAKTPSTTGQTSDDGANLILIRVKLSVSAYGLHAYLEERGGSVRLWRSFLTDEVGEDIQYPGLHRLRQIHALVVLSPGGVVRFTDKYEPLDMRNDFKLSRTQGIVFNDRWKTTVQSLSYDGKTISLQKFHYRNIQPRRAA